MTFLPLGVADRPDSSFLTFPAQRERARSAMALVVLMGSRPTFGGTVTGIWFAYVQMNRTTPCQGLLRVEPHPGAPTQAWMVPHQRTDSMWLRSHAARAHDGRSPAGTIPSHGHP